MKFSIKEKKDKKLQIGSLMVSGNSKFLVVKSVNKEFPFALVVLVDNVIEDEYASLNSIEKDWNCYNYCDIYNPDELVMEVKE